MTTPTTPLIIAFDTIFEQCAIAIIRGEQILYHERTLGARGQTEIILPMLDAALAHTGISMAQVDAWAFNRGPGAFSGIRINTALVQALSVANDAPCVGVSSLHTLAFAAHLVHAFGEGTCISTAIDARQNEVYAGDFLVKNDTVIPATDHHEYLAAYGSPMQADVIVGDGAALVNSTAQVLDIHPDATHIARLALPVYLAGQALSAEHALPVYLRHNAWKTLAEQGRA